VLPESQAARLTVVLVATRNPLNIGAAARAMSNFGILDLRVVRPWEPAFREAVSAVGAADLLQTAPMYDTVAEAVADCSLVIGTSAGARRETEHTIHTLATAAPLVRTHLENARAAILFGSEKFGLSNEDLSHCDWLLHIPTRAEHLSMNLGQAVAVCVYELTREAAPLTTIPAQQQEAATAEERERLTAILMESLAASGYLEKHPQTTLHEQVRRMVTRLQFNTRDAHSLLGMLRQSLWKMRSTDK
jgi:tRNA/rRNA methyltransferase